MRIELRVFRARQGNMTQEEFADKIGFSRSQYALVETGNRDGSQDFWKKLKETFNVPEADMWALMQNTKDKEKAEE